MSLKCHSITRGCITMKALEIAMANRVLLCLGVQCSVLSGCQVVLWCAKGEQRCVIIGT